MTSGNTATAAFERWVPIPTIAFSSTPGRRPHRARLSLMQRQTPTCSGLALAERKETCGRRALP